MIINLNARRAAASKTRKDPVWVQVGDRQYELAKSVRLKVMEYVQDSDFAGAAKLLLANPDKDWEAFANDVNLDELGEIIGAYGTSMGESDASTDSSATTGEPSGPTSAASTVSTLPNAVTPPAKP